MILVATSYDKEAICPESYERMTGCLFATLVEKHFDQMFQLAGNVVSHLWMQDGNPCHILCYYVSLYFFTQQSIFSCCFCLPVCI